MSINRNLIYEFINKNIIQLERNIPLNKYNTWKVGGPAEAFVIVKTRTQMLDLFKIINKEKLPYFLLGKGANILISDKGFQGLIIKNEIDDFEIGETFINKNVNEEDTTQRNIRSELDNEKRFLRFSDIYYNDKTKKQTKIKVGSGYNLTKLISDSLKKDLVGLQWFHGIPATVGGAIFNNIHGGSRQMEDYIDEVEVIIEDKIEILKHKDIKWGYDYSSFHETKYPILSATFNLFHSDPVKAQKAGISWLTQKVKQPKASCGCVFLNLDKDIAKEKGYLSSSTGYFIDKILDLNGTKIGDAQIAENHGNFIVNTDNATAKDIYLMIQKIKQIAKEREGIELKEECFYVGDFSYIK